MKKAGEECPQKSEKKYAAPDCGAKTTARMWSGINAEVNPNLRLSVLDESLFDWRCPQCGYEAMLAYPCLYHDKGRRFMIYILPGKPDPAKAAGIGAQFPQLRGVRKRVTGSLATLKEKSCSLRTVWTTGRRSWSSSCSRWC